MALVKCPDCGREISSTAPSCIQCGRQMVATTVEQTAKPIKAARAVGCLSMPVGLFLLALGIADHSGGIITLGFLCTFGGLIAYVGAGALKWWRHE